MCIACEMAMVFLMDDIPPSTGTASHDKPDAAARFVCETPDDAPLAAPPSQDERKP